MSSNSIVYLGPFGTTFTHDARIFLGQIFTLPSNLTYVPAPRNDIVLELAITQKGYAVLAMETLAEARVTTSLESFVGLLNQYSERTCPIKVIGAAAMELHFCLMARPGVTLASLTGVVAHNKSFGACREAVGQLALPLFEVESNGEAVRRVAQETSYATMAALAPRTAASHYGLSVLNYAFEDERAVTTFFLVSPHEESLAMHLEASALRGLLIFESTHRPGALLDVLSPFKDEHINLVQIHSVGMKGNAYRFAVEAECSPAEDLALKRALTRASEHTSRRIVFGPFPLFRQ